MKFTSQEILIRMRIFQRFCGSLGYYSTLELKNAKTGDKVYLRPFSSDDDYYEFLCFSDEESALRFIEIDKKYGDQVERDWIRLLALNDISALNVVIHDLNDKPDYYSIGIEKFHKRSFKKRFEAYALKILGCMELEIQLLKEGSENFGYSYEKLQEACQNAVEAAYPKALESSEFHSFINPKTKEKGFFFALDFNRFKKDNLKAKFLIFPDEDFMNRFLEYYSSKNFNLEEDFVEALTLLIEQKEGEYVCSTTKPGQLEFLEIRDKDEIVSGFLEALKEYAKQSNS